MPKRNLQLRVAKAEEIKQLATITPSDIARAQSAFEELAPSPFRTLLDAVNDPTPDK